MMNKLLLLSLTFITLSSGAIINPFLFLNSSTNPRVVEPNASYGAPDSRLEISPSFQGTRIPMISCLMGVVNILVTLSLDEWWGTIPATSWHHDDHPQVTFMILPAVSGGRIERRFVIWALGQAANLMMDLTKFECVSFLITWNKAAVGSLLIVDGRRNINGGINLASGTGQRLIQQSAAVTSNVSLLTPSYLTSADVVEYTDDQRLHVKVSLVGSGIDVPDVLRMVITVIVAAAEQKPTERIQEFVSPENVPRVKLTFLPPIPPPTNPPFFEIQWLIKAVAAIPTFMLKKGRFREALLMLEVDGIKVADGFLQAG